MGANLFWPIYKKLEDEFKDLSYYIKIDNKQMKTYSIKIADLILRIVAECENISSEICKREKIKFKDKKGHIKKVVNFNEYIDALNKIFNLENKLVNPIFVNMEDDTFYSKLTPFRKEKIKVNGADKSILKWYNAYNKIKHDRTRNFKMANLENLIYSLSALFMLNIYFRNEIYYDTEDSNFDTIISKIESFSDVFCIDYAVRMKEDDNLVESDSFFDPVSYFEIALPMSVYVLERDIVFKTDSDKFYDRMDKLE